MTVNSKLLYIVTGANKGIGYQVTKELIEKTKEPVKILLTCRDIPRGHAALNKIHAETKNERADGVEIEFRQLDITDEKSIKNFLLYLNAEFGSAKPCIDLLINNAGYGVFGAPDPKGEIATTTIKTNYFGTVRLTEHLWDYFNQNSRVIFVSSGVAKYQGAARELQPSYFIESFKTKDEIENHLNEIIAKAQQGQYENGAPSQSYCVSKAGMTTYAWLLSQKHKNDPRRVLVVSCDPGWVNTDMGGPHAPLTLEEGAMTPIYLALHDFEELYKHNGKYFHKSCMEDW